MLQPPASKPLIKRYRTYHARCMEHLYQQSRYMLCIDTGVSVSYLYIISEAKNTYSDLPRRWRVSA